MTYSDDSLKELIPLYLTGKITPEERRRIEEIVTASEELKREISECTEIREHYREIACGMPLPSSELREKVRSRIRQMKVQEESRSGDLFSGISDSIRNMFAQRWLPWGLAAAQLIIILALVIPGMKSGKIETLSSPQMVQPKGDLFTIIFREDAKEGEIRDLLSQSGLTIVRGPSQDGLYLVAPEAGRMGNDILKSLRGAAIVRFAEKAY